MKLFLKYCPYLISSLGLLISINRIFNIVGRKFYQHPKEHRLTRGQNITPETLPPIFLILQEKQESQVIIKHLEKYVSKQLQVALVSRSQFLNYFIDSESKELDKPKLVNTIQRIVSSLPLRDQELLSHYCSAQNSRKPLIHQLIQNQLTLWQLDLDQKTKVVFDQIKDKWIEMVSWDTSNSKFALDQARFEGIIREKLSSSSHNKEILLNDYQQLPDGVDRNLLGNSILAHAFSFQEINMSPVEVAVSIKEQVKSSSIFKLLKFDLKDTHKIKYGIDYDIKNNVLNFSGLVEDDLEGRTIVIQITTIKNRLLKEIWIYGPPKSIGNQNETIDHLPNENHYEVY